MATNEKMLRRINESTVALTTVVVDLITTVNRIVDQTLANQIPNDSYREDGYNLQELKVIIKLILDFLGTTNRSHCSSYSTSIGSIETCKT
jgi:hypothetical protein